MDRVTKSLLTEFKETFEISELIDEVAFEHFCNYSILSNQYNKTFEYSDIWTGGGYDCGIDGLAIIVNGHLVDNQDDIDAFLENNGYLDATLIFIQAKTTTNYDSGEVLKFYNGVSDFFSENPTLRRNDEIKNAAELVSYLFNLASKFRKNPILKYYYVYTGNLPDKNDLSGLVKTHRKSLIGLNLFDKIDSEILGAKEIVALYRKSKNQVSASFHFPNKTLLPNINGVEEAYYGVLQYSEFKKLILDENDNLISVFDENVRDFQGPNTPVNSEISKTLRSEFPDRFSVLNNGVTIVADSIHTSRDAVTITDYQIVNGCQTSNVLFENRDVVGIDDIYIPIRLIVTKNKDVLSQITVSTNNQTAIKKEQLSAMSDFQKGLEQYYNARVNEVGLKYERRAKQYTSDVTVTKRKIISIANQVKSFSAMFRQNPHLVTTYFGTLTKLMTQEGSGLCDSDHQYGTYYMAGLAYYKLDILFSSGAIEKRFKKVKFYLLMLFLKIATANSTPPLNSRRKTESFCEPIIKKLMDEKKCQAIFKIACNIIDRSGAKIEDKQALKSKPMTDLILNEFSETDRV